MRTKQITEKEIDHAINRAICDYLNKIAGLPVNERPNEVEKTIAIHTIAHKYLVEASYINKMATKVG